MLRITTLRADDRVVLKLEGRFLAPWVNEVEACWREAVRTSRDPVWVDLGEVSGVDAAGEAQLARMCRDGARFVARGCLMRELVRRIGTCAE